MRPSSTGSVASTGVSRVSGSGSDSSMSIRRLRPAVTTVMRWFISSARRADSVSTVRRSARADER